MARNAVGRIPPRNGSRHSILVVEDDADLLKLVGEVLAKAGFLTRFARSRAEINAEFNKPPLPDLGPLQAPPGTLTPDSQRLPSFIPADVDRRRPPWRYGRRQVSGRQARGLSCSGLAVFAELRYRAPTKTPIRCSARPC